MRAGGREGGRMRGLDLRVAVETREYTFDDGVHAMKQMVCETNGL